LVHVEIASSTEVMGMSTAEIQGKLWGQAPQDWATLQEPVHKPLWQAMLNETSVRSGTRILDAGCGGGGACLLAAERGALVSAVDASEGLIQFARSRAPEVDFRVGDIESLPYEDNSFDVVFAANSIQYAGDRVKALREFRRVCRPGGRIVSGLFGSPDKVAFRTIFAAVRDVLPEPPAGGGPYELSMPGKLESLFEKAGLKLLTSGEVNCPFHYPDFETFWRAQNSAGPFQRAVQIAGKKKLRLVLLRAVELYRNGNGTILIQPNLYKYVVADF